MSMFDNYEKINKDIHPNNTHDTSTKQLIEIDKSVPMKLFNVKHEFIGYFIDRENNFDLKLSSNYKIRVNKDSIVYNQEGEKPTKTTFGYKGLQAYNTIDNKSWTCYGFYNGEFLWEEDKKITYDSNGTKEIEMIVDMLDKTIEATIYDFRWEPIETFSNSNSTELFINFNTELYDKLKNGVYHCVVRIIGNKSSYINENFILSVN